MLLVSSVQWELQAEEGVEKCPVQTRRRGEGGWPASKAHSCYPRLLELPASTLLRSAVLRALGKGGRVSPMGSSYVGHPSVWKGMGMEEEGRYT